MKKCYFVGVDGGGTKTRLQLEDQAGNVLAKAISGPGSIRWSVETTWQSINSGFDDLCQQSQLDPNDENIEFYAGCGLAGHEIPDACDAFLATPNPFKKIILNSDGYTACLGAHNNHDGAIITVGTGVVGFLIEQGKTTRVGGWGFPHDDEGGGAWLGLQATRLVFQWLDGRIDGSPLLSALHNRFEQDADYYNSWANNAFAKQFASLAPMVIEFSEKNDPNALQLMTRAGKAIDLLYHGMLQHQKTQQHLPYCLFGGIAPFIKPYVCDALQNQLVERKYDATKGAVIMARQALLGK